MIKLTKHGDTVILYQANGKWNWELRVSGSNHAEGSAETKEAALQAAADAVKNRGDVFPTSDTPWYLK